MININIEKKIKGQNDFFKYQLSLEKNDIIGISGPSGKGKTTFFNIISGILKADKGSIIFDEQVWADSENNIHLPAQQRKVGYVFQDYALFPNMTAAENIAFGKSDQLTDHELEDIINTFEIGDILSKSVKKLSGGQKQRVAIVRSLAQLPQLVLMDEPFAALDHKIKKNIIKYLSEYQEKYSIPFLINSHQIEELDTIITKLFHFSSHQLEESILLKKTTFQRGIIVNIDRKNNVMEVKFDQFTTTLPSNKNMKIGEIIEISHQK